MAKTKIEWTEENFNPFYGCRRVSEGCQNCYAEQIAGRFSGIDKNGKIQPFSGIATKVNGVSRWTGNVKLNEQVLLAPLKNKKPTRYFVNSMSDTFYSEIPREWIDRLFAVMALCPQHTFQVLTKRPERMREYLRPDLHDTRVNIAAWMKGNARKYIHNPGQYLHVFPLPNVWLGASVENQKTADERIPLLLDTPAAVRWLSCEPLLEEIDFYKSSDTWFEKGYTPWKNEPILTGIDWVIVGGESGAKTRPCHTNWIRSIVRQCKTAKVSCFVKQLGAYVQIQSPNSNFDSEIRVKLENRKGGDMSEFPEDLQIREFPV